MMMMMMMAQHLNLRVFHLCTVIILIFVPNSFESNDQFQLPRKLNPLRTYKDAQFFRYQIPEETVQAVFSFNASQSDQPINTTIVNTGHNFGMQDPSSNRTYLFRADQKAFFQDDNGTQPIGYYANLPKWINVTKIDNFTKRMVKFYNSILSTACKRPLDVKFILRWGSIPILSIKNASFPENSVGVNVTNQFEIDMKTDGQLVMFNLTNPLPGDWYGMAFINKTSDKILQKGLERECFYYLMSNVRFKTTDNGPSVQVLQPSPNSSLKQSLVIDGHQSQQQQQQGQQQQQQQDQSQHPTAELLYKFYLNLKEYGVKIIITNCHFRPSTNLRHHSSFSSSAQINSVQQQQQSQNAMNYDQQQNATGKSLNNTCPIELNIRALALPNKTNHEFSFNCHTNNSNNVELINDKCIIDLPSYAPNQWNYIQIVPSMNHSEQTMFGGETRTKWIYGTINFTIQILAGQEAFLYNYFNDQNCQIQQQQSQSASTLMPNNNNYNSFVAKNEASNIYSNLYTTVTSVRNPKTMNSNQIKDLNSKKKMVIDDGESTTVAESKNTKKTKSILLINNNNMDLAEFNEDESENFTIQRMNQLSKRSADPQPQPQGSPNRDRKQKSDRKKDERQKNKKQKNKNRQKNREKIEKECQFDPNKIMSTLDEDDLMNMTTFSTFNLTRYQTSDNFEFRYSYFDLMAPINVTLANSSGSPLYIEVDNEKYSLFNFTLIPQFDIGGSLEIDFAISPWTNNSYQNVSAILCLSHNRLPPIYPSSNGVRLDEYCFGYLVSNTSATNFTTMGSHLQTMVVPYPQPGIWFISIMVQCYSQDDELDDLLVVNQDAGNSCDYFNKTSILIDIHSAACLNSRCLNNGKCQQYLNAGILYSTCQCRAGYKGLYCNDASEALSPQKLLMNFLLLTISNAAFIPAIVLAAFRRYFTESAIYFITMISSGLYHACDSDFSQSYCVFSVSLLQFADFYTAILSFFVTLLTLAHLKPPCKSFLHLLGAILIALITQNDRTSLWTFVIPAGIGTTLLFCCWCSRCCRKSCYPPARCWIFSVCPALILTIVGLIIYAFFETQDNYALTHSIWHGTVALALFLAIPSMPSQNQTENDGDEDEEHVHFMSTSSSSAGGSGKGINNNKTNPETYYELIGEEKSHLARSHAPTSLPSQAQTSLPTVQPLSTHSPQQIITKSY